MLCYGGRRLDAADDTVTTGDDLWRYTFSSTGAMDVAADATAGDAEAADATTGWEQLQHDAHRPSPGALEDAAAVALPGLRDGMLLLGGRRESGGDPVGALWRVDVDCTGAQGSSAVSAVWSRIHPAGRSSFSHVPPHASHLLFWATDDTLVAFGGSKPANQPNQDAWLEPAVALPDGLEVSTSAALWSWNATRCELGRGLTTAEDNHARSTPTCPTQPILCGTRSQPATVNVVLLGATSAEPYTLYVKDTEADVAVPVRTTLRNTTVVGEYDAVVFLVEDLPVWRLPSQTFTVTAVSAQGSMEVQCQVTSSRVSLSLVSCHLVPLCMRRACAPDEPPALSLRNSPPFGCCAAGVAGGVSRVLPVAIGHAATFCVVAADAAWGVPDGACGGDVRGGAQDADSQHATSAAAVRTDGGEHSGGCRGRQRRLRRRCERCDSRRHSGHHDAATER